MANVLHSRQRLGPGNGVKRRVLDNQVRVSTPENIAFQYEITGPSRRLMAYLADVIITLLVFGLAAIACSVMFGVIASLIPNAAIIGFLADVALGIFLTCGFLSLWFYGAYMETVYNGQTFGKMLANIRTISTDGSAIDGTQATLRNFFRLLDVSPIVSLGLFFGPEVGDVFVFPIFAFGLICMTISPKYQRIGDLVAGTIVITEERKWAHGLAKFQDPRVPELAQLLPESFVVTPGLATALAEYVDRRRILPPQRVTEVAAHLGRPLLVEFGLPADTNKDLLLCSLYYKTFVDHKQDQEANPFLKKPIQTSSSESANPETESVEEIP